jgi:molybdate-binding protein
LDECLCAIEAAPSKVSGYNTAYESDFAAINAVAEGKADVCIANVDAVSGAEGVLFVALGYEQVDLVVRKDKGTESLQKAVWDLLADKNLLAGLEAISKCNTAKLGQVVYEI